MNFALSRSAAPAVGCTAARRGSVVAFARASANGAAIKVRPFFLRSPLVREHGLSSDLLQVPTAMRLFAACALAVTDRSGNRAFWIKNESVRIEWLDDVRGRLVDLDLLVGGGSGHTHARCELHFGFFCSRLHKE